MTSTVGNILFVDDSTWRLERLENGIPACFPIEGTDTRTRVEALQQLVGPGLQQRSDVVLALPSRLCLCSSIDLPPKGSRLTHEEMAYLLEEKIPMEAEDCVAAFVVSGCAALGACIAQNPLREIVRELGSKNIDVIAITPLSMLTAQSIVESSTDEDVDAIVIGGNGKAVDLIWLNGKQRPSGWQVIQADADAIASHIHARTIAREHSKFRLLEIALAPETLSALQSNSLEILTCRTDLHKAALGAAGEFARGTLTPWLNFRPSFGASQFRRLIGPLRFAAAGLVILCIALALSFWLRTRNYDRQLRRSQQEQQTLFASLFPNSPIPIDVHSRLMSESRRLRDLSGSNLDSEPPTQAAHATPTLYAVLGAIPQSLRFQLLDVRVDGDTVYLEGLVRAHSDADAIAVSLRRVAGLAVQSPKSEQRGTEKGVSFSLAGEIAAGSPTHLSGGAP